MKSKLYLTDPAQKNISSDEKYRWVHLFQGESVPPLLKGSFNHLIRDLLQDNTDHILISKYFEESYKISKPSNISIAYIDYKPRIELKSKIIHFITRRQQIDYGDFLKESFNMINKVNCDNIMVWGTPLYLNKLRFAFPDKTIVYNQRVFDHGYDITAKYQYCDMLLTQTPNTTKFAFERNYALEPLTFTIPNGVETNTFVPQPIEFKNKLKGNLGINPNSFVVIWPSKLNPIRGTAYLLKWIEYFKKTNPNIHFLIAGSWSTSKALKGDHKKLDYVLRNYDNVTWIKNSPRDKMPELYGAAEIALIPGLMRDGMSMALAESLSCGLPVVATDRGTYPEIIKNGYNGTICNTENLYVKVIEAIEEFFGNKKLLEQIGSNARAYTVTRLPREKCLQNYKHFFNERYQEIDNRLSIP